MVDIELFAVPAVPVGPKKWLLVNFDQWLELCTLARNSNPEVTLLQVLLVKQVQQIVQCQPL